MRRLGRYELVDELGRGGAAIVYLARDTVTDRAVAVKVLASQLPHQADLVTRFQREIKLAVQLDHPHIVPIYDVGVEDDQPYIVLRLLSGGSLADRLQYGPLTVFTAVSVLRQVASALDAAHRLKIIHRDVKPSNILFDKNDTAYLADFGIAKAIDAATTPMNSWAVGTPAFMSPEQLRGQPIDARTDEYALGLVAFTMLTGRLAYEGTAAHIITQQLIEPLPNACLINPQLPIAIQAVLEHATAKDPALRYASAGEFVMALDSALQGWVALGGITPELEAEELAPARAGALAAPVLAPALAAAPPPAVPDRHLSLNRDMAPPSVSPAAVGTGAAPTIAAAPPRPGRRRWPWLAVVAGLVVVIALFTAWQAGAFGGAAPLATATNDQAATAAAGLAGTQSAAIISTNAPPATALPLSVTLAPDAIGLAIITVPPGTDGAALRASPTGATIQVLPDRTIVQVFAGRQQLPDGSFWVPIGAPSGATGWVAEALLRYLNSPTATLTPETDAAISATPALSAGATQRPGAGRTPGVATATGLPTASGEPAATGLPAATGQPDATHSPTQAPAATAPGSAGTAPAATPKPSSTPPGPLPSATGPLATHTAPPATVTGAPSSTVAPSHTPPAPTNTPVPPSSTPVPTSTPVLQGILPTQLCILPPLCQRVRKK